MSATAPPPPPPRTSTRAIATPRVIGGSAVPAGELGAVANVVVGGRPTCSGVLVAPRWVLTAGHCGSATGLVSDGLLGTRATLPAGAYAVRLGTVATDGSGGTTTAVDDVRLAPGYAAGATIGASDVALLHLASASAVAPIPIVAPADRALWAAGASVTAAGFGVTSADATDPPPTMRRAALTVGTDAACAAAYPADLASSLQDGGGFDATTMLCAGAPGGVRDTCTGDSGGPLLVGTPAGLRVVATTSFGRGCADPTHPGVYARVAAEPLRGWIGGVAPGALAADPPPAAAIPPARVVHLRVRRVRTSAGRRALEVRVTLDRAARVTIVLRRAGRTVLRAHRALPAGRSVVRLAGARAGGLAPGTYRVAVAATGAGAVTRRARVR